MNKHKTRIAVLLAAVMLAGLAFFYFYKLGSHPLIDWDEAIYAQVARQSLATKSIFDMHWYGNVSAQNPTGLWIEKPPLTIWLLESAYLVFGINEFAVRFWSALFAAAVVFMTFVLAKHLFRSWLVGLLAVSLYFFVHYFTTQAWYMGMDIPVTFFILLSLWAFLKSKQREWYYYLFWAAVGLGVMTKSAIGLLPLPLIAVCALAAKDFNFLKNRNFYFGVGAFAVIALPWHLVEIWRHGKEFWDSYLMGQILRRYAEVIDKNAAPFWFYLGVLKDNLVFLLMSIAAFGYFLFKSLRSKQDRKSYIFIALPAAFILLFFSSSVTKRSTYLVVLYPFLVIMAAKLLADLVAISKNAKFQAFCMVGIIAIFVASSFVFNRSKIADSGYYGRYYSENKAYTQLASKYFPSLPVLLIDRDLPAAIFYADNKVHAYSPETKITAGSLVVISASIPSFGQATLLAKGSTANLFLVTVN